MSDWASLPMFTPFGFIDRDDVMWHVSSAAEVNPLLAANHYLGPIKSGGARLVVAGRRNGSVVAAQVWRHPTARHIPADGSVLELSRWCLTPDAGDYAGSRNHKYAVRLIRQLMPDVRVLLSYSDPSHGHTGSLYRAANWRWFPTWMRLREPPSRGGSWDGVVAQAVKDRWAFVMKGADVGWLLVTDAAAIRHWAEGPTEAEIKWARQHPQLSEHLGAA